MFYYTVSHYDKLGHISHINSSRKVSTRDLLCDKHQNVISVMLPCSIDVCSSVESQGRM